MVVQVERGAVVWRFRFATATRSTLPARLCPAEAGTAYRPSPDRLRPGQPSSARRSRPSDAAVVGERPGMTVTRAPPPDTRPDQREPCSFFAVVSWWWSPPFVPLMYPASPWTDPARRTAGAVGRGVATRLLHGRSPTFPYLPYGHCLQQRRRGGRRSSCGASQRLLLA